MTAQAGKSHWQLTEPLRERKCCGTELISGAHDSSGRQQAAMEGKANQHKAMFMQVQVLWQVVPSQTVPQNPSTQEEL